MKRDFILCATPICNAMKKAFDKHRHHAKVRDIDFLFTLDEWCRVWEESGHWFDRGTRSDQYVMARFNDTGPYQVGNVEIITAAENTKQWLARVEHPMTEESLRAQRQNAKRRWDDPAQREAQSKLMKDVPKTLEQRQRMSEARKLAWASGKRSRVQSAETRRKRSESHLARHARLREAKN